MPRELSQSDLLRAALRADESGETPLGLGSATVIKLIDDMNAATSFDAWGDQELNVARTSGLLANDIVQGKPNDYDAPEPFIVTIIDTSFTLADGYIAPANGTVIVNTDGSFTYTAGPGFNGTDRFTYRSTQIIEGLTETVYSNTATVVITTVNAQSGENVFSSGFDGGA